MFAFNAYWTSTLAVGIAFSVAFLSFSVSTGEGGILCLGQAGLAAFGAIVAGRLATDAGLPLPLGIVIAVLCATFIGVVLGIVGTRLDRVGFALVTLAFALFCDKFAFNLQSLIPLAGVNYPVVQFGGLNPARSAILLGAVVFAVLAFGVAWFRRGRFGRVFAAIRDNPIEGESLGINVKAYRVGIFTLGSAIAGLGGALIGIEQGSISTSDFALLTGLVWLAVAVTIGVRGYGGALRGRPRVRHRPGRLRARQDNRVRQPPDRAVRPGRGGHRPRSARVPGPDGRRDPEAAGPARADARWRSAARRARRAGARGRGREEP